MLERRENFVPYVGIGLGLLAAAAATTTFYTRLRSLPALFALSVAVNTGVFISTYFSMDFILPMFEVKGRISDDGWFTAGSRARFERGEKNANSWFFLCPSLLWSRSARLEREAAQSEQPARVPLAQAGCGPKK